MYGLVCMCSLGVGSDDGKWPPDPYARLLDPAPTLLQELAEAVGDPEWVLVLHDTCLDAEHTMLDVVNFGTPLQRVYAPIVNGSKVRALTEVMGVLKR